MGVRKIKDDVVQVGTRSCEDLIETDFYSGLYSEFLPIGF